ncbi:hypothetical protein I8T81_07090 [Acinetobacter seifertii]|uniref:hypothetical protein n=1 Tax=Acinetobacter seifertii TaxID=1530123 RepID=UPI0018DE9CC0|nr:hypothetical protein [Acinetobacter seifertii]QPV60575.1 hypothetical protein I8T81_07090 [Acinetobacter seifertii]
MMKKVLFVLIGMLLVGCTEKKPLTPEEQWHGFCTSVGNAARSIVFDRQQAIEKSQAVEHANKIEDEITKKFILNIIEKVYAIPQDQLKTNPEALQEKIRKQMADECLVTPHDKMPNYKKF